MSCRFLLLILVASDLKIKRASRSFVGQVSQMSFFKGFFRIYFRIVFYMVFLGQNGAKREQKSIQNGYFYGSVFGIVV